MEKWESAHGRWQVPSDPRPVSVEYLWSIEAYEDIEVPGGTSKAFRIVLQLESREPNAPFGRKRLVAGMRPT